MESSAKRFALLEAVTAVLADPVFVLDREGRYVEVLGGSNRDEYDSPRYLIGKTLHEALPAVQADRFLDDIRRVLDHGEPREREFMLDRSELKDNPRDGPAGPQWFRLRMVPIPAGRPGVPECVVASTVNITRRRQLEEEMRQLASTDELTGIANRRTFFAELKQVLNTTPPQRRPRVQLALIDLDHFKQINDRYGHLLGDAVLRHVAGLLRAGLGAPGLARIGGEEFALLQPEGEIEVLAQQLRQVQADLQQRPFEQGGLRIAVTMSAGLTSATAEDRVPGDLMRRADHWLFEAKRAGRDRVAWLGWDALSGAADPA